MKKNLIPTVFLKNNTFYVDRSCNSPFASQEFKSVSKFYGSYGADALCIIEYSLTDEEHDHHINIIKQEIRQADIPVYVGGYVKRFEDVKKYFYTGAKKVLFWHSKDTVEDALMESSKRFGLETILFVVTEDTASLVLQAEAYVGGYLLFDSAKIGIEELSRQNGKYILFYSEHSGRESCLRLLNMSPIDALSGTFVSGLETNLTNFKYQENMITNILSWSDLKQNSDGMIPVIVQDYKSNEVLMLAYMNEEAFQSTIATGKMTYFSRSRNELWIKGLTSGHFQFVKSITTDCDKDTLLAKVAQVGAACHTGNYSCFFNEIIKKEWMDNHSSKVLDEVFHVILDRKEHPKEGSYTNYLFDKGIDKILKKVGEEAAEIIIAAKNPDAEEIIYEISDFLYHVMVLMAEKGVAWDDVVRELGNR